jgi:hypothetical protein
MDLQPPAANNNDKIKKEIVTLLKKRTAVLMVGAGSSSVVRYPSWKKLLTELKNQFFPELIDPSDGEDLSIYGLCRKPQ